MDRGPVPFGVSQRPFPPYRTLLRAARAFLHAAWAARAQPRPARHVSALRARRRASAVKGEGWRETKQAAAGSRALRSRVLVECVGRCAGAASGCSTTGWIGARCAAKPDTQANVNTSRSTRHPIIPSTGKLLALDRRLRLPWVVARGRALLVGQLGSNRGWAGWAPGPSPSSRLISIPSRRANKPSGNGTALAALHCGQRGQGIGESPSANLLRHFRTSAVAAIPSVWLDCVAKVSLSKI